MPHDRFRIVFVCTGNICRSPMAEGLVRQALASSAHPEADRVVVQSAGVHGFENAAMEGQAAAILRQLGGDPSAFRSRRLSASMIGPADLVLTAQREHHAAVLSFNPEAVHKTFTMLEFARLVRHVHGAALDSDGLVARGRSLVAAAAAQRGQVDPVPAAADELADPFGGSEASFRLCADNVSAALDWVPRLLDHPQLPRADVPGRSLRRS